MLIAFTACKCEHRSPVCDRAHCYCGCVVNIKHFSECYKYEKRKRNYISIQTGCFFYQTGISLTTLNRMRGRLERHVLPPWLGNVDAEHQPNASILPPDVRLAFPQLYISIPELQNSSTVDSRKQPESKIEKSYLLNLFKKHDDFMSFLSSFLLHQLLISLKQSFSLILHHKHVNQHEDIFDLL